MNPKTTGILFAIAAALGAFVYFYEIEGEEGRKEAEAAEKRLFPDIAQDAIESIALPSSDGAVIRFERREGRWQIVEPIDFAADSFAADGVASALADLKSESLIDDPRPHEVYGLDAEGGEIRFRAGGVERVLRLGDDTPLGSNSYVAVDGSTDVYTVTTTQLGSLRKDLEELRDKRIANFDHNAVLRFTASWPDGRVAVERSEQGWQLTAPVQGSADDSTVDGLLSDLSFLRATGFVDDPTPEAVAGFERPEFAVEIELKIENEGEDLAPLSIAFGGLDEAGTDQLVRAAAQSLYAIPASRLEDFPRTLVEYRDRQLAKFSSLDVERIEMGFRSGGQTEAITGVHGDEGWTSSPESFEDGKLANLVNELSRLRADGILADAMGRAELESIGLEPASAIFSVFGASEDDSEGLIAEIQLGDLRDDGIPARTPDRETIFLLDAELAEHIPLSLEAVRNRFLAEPEPAELDDSPAEDDSDAAAGEK
jgi:hypothetical protein